MLQAIDLTKRYEVQELAPDALNIEIKEGEISILLTGEKLQGTISVYRNKRKINL
jgi:hypothetical protein